MNRQSVLLVTIAIIISACHGQESGVHVLSVQPSPNISSPVVTPETVPAGDDTNADGIIPSDDGSDITDDEPEDPPVIDESITPGNDLLVEIGERLFRDTNLSSPPGQSCESCHSDKHGFTDPDTQHPTSLSADGTRFGTRNSATLFYVAHIPNRSTVNRTNPITLQPTAREFGGLFLDGRADTLEDQVIAPLFNPAEMALPSAQELQVRIGQSNYADKFRVQFGNLALEDTSRTLQAVADAVAAFERTDRFSPFSSKFDDVQAGRASFTAAEQRGQQLFNGRALCSLCHQSPGDTELFSDFLYHNIGTPRNQFLLNNIGDQNFVDTGLGGQTSNTAHAGQFRTPTLRNVELTAPYMHNGVFQTLEEVIEFYDSNITSSEVSLNVVPFIGNLGLSENDKDDLEAFLKTLTDQ